MPQDHGALRDQSGMAPLSRWHGALESSHVDRVYRRSPGAELDKRPTTKARRKLGLRKRLARPRAPADVGSTGLFGSGWLFRLFRSSAFGSVDRVSRHRQLAPHAVAVAVAAWRRLGRGARIGHSGMAGVAAVFAW